jgi:mycothiol synthase
MIKEGLPRGFVLRHPTLDDVEAIASVINAGEIALHGVAETTAEDMRRWLTSPGLDFPKDTWLVQTTEGRVVASAAIIHQQHAHIYIPVDVHPDYQRRGIGTYLLHLAEEQAKEHIALAEPDSRVAVDTETDSKNLAAQQLLQRHGFERNRIFWRMGIEMQEAPSVPPLPEGMTLRTLAADMSLAHAVYEADEEAFQDHWGYMPHTYEEFEHWTINRDSFDPSLLFLGMADNEVAGFALCADEKEAGGWVHVLGVRRPWRKQGLGLFLLRHAFGEFYRRGIHNVYLGVDAQSLTGATRLYERAGMHIVRQFYRYEKELRAGREPSTQSLGS